MNDVEIQRLAAAGHALRPDWPVASLRTWLETNHTGRSYRDAAVALAFIATDPTTRTPKRMDERGPWWQASTVRDGTPTPPRLNDRCRTHLGPAHNCPGCRADAIARPDETPYPEPTDAHASRRAL